MVSGPRQHQEYSGCLDECGLGGVIVGFELLQDGGSGLGGEVVCRHGWCCKRNLFKRRWACSDKSLTPPIRCARMLGLSPNNVETVAKGVDYL